MLLPIWLFHVPGSNVTIWFCKKCISLNLGHLSCSRSKCNVTIWFCCTWRKKCISLNLGHPALSGFRFKCNDTILMYQEKELYTFLLNLGYWALSGSRFQVQIFKCLFPALTKHYHYILPQNVVACSSFFIFIFVVAKWPHWHHDPLFRHCRAYHCRLALRDQVQSWDQKTKTFLPTSKVVSWKYGCEEQDVSNSKHLILLNENLTGHSVNVRESTEVKYGSEVRKWSTEVEYGSGVRKWRAECQ